MLWYLYSNLPIAQARRAWCVRHLQSRQLVLLQQLHLPQRVATTSARTVARRRWWQQFSERRIWWHRIAVTSTDFDTDSGAKNKTCHSQSTLFLQGTSCVEFVQFSRYRLLKHPLDPGSIPQKNEIKQTTLNSSPSFLSTGREPDVSLRPPVHFAICAMHLQCHGPLSSWLRLEKW